MKRKRTKPVAHPATSPSLSPRTTTGLERGKACLATAFLNLQNACTTLRIALNDRHVPDAVKILAARCHDDCFRAESAVARSQDVVATYVDLER